MQTPNANLVKKKNAERRPPSASRALRFAFCVFCSVFCAFPDAHVGAAEPTEAAYRVPAEAAAWFAPHETLSYRMTPAAASEGAILHVQTAPPPQGRTPLARLADAPTDVAAYLAQPPDDTLPPEARRQARALVRDAGGVEDAALAVLGWVHDRVAYDPKARSESAATAYMQRRADCRGQSALAAAMMREAGIPARTVHGVFLRSAAPGLESAFAVSTLHRWTEYWIPGRGWASADPGRPNLAVDARYLRFETAPRLVDMNAFRAATLWMTPKPKASAPAAARAGVFGIVSGGDEARLRDARVRVTDAAGRLAWKQTLDGRRAFAFTDLTPGDAYAIEFTCPGYPPRRVAFTAPRSGVHSIVIELPPAPTAP